MFLFFLSKRGADIFAQNLSGVDQGPAFCSLQKRFDFFTISSEFTTFWRVRKTSQLIWSRLRSCLLEVELVRGQIWKVSQFPQTHKSLWKLDSMEWSVSVIWRNTFYKKNTFFDLDKYILKILQIHFTISTIHLAIKSHLITQRSRNGHWKCFKVQEWGFDYHLGCNLFEL